MSHPKKPWFAIASVFAGLAMAATACSSPTSQGGGSSSSDSSGGLTTVKVGMIPAGSAGGFIDMAQQQGYYKACGVNLQVTQVASGAQLAPALVSGAVNMAIESPQEMLLAVAKGTLQAKVIGSVEDGLPWAIYGGKNVTSLKDLAGKTIATSSSTSLNTIVASLILKQNGVDPSGIKWVNTGSNADKYKAVVTGLTAGASVPSDYIPQATRDGLHILATASQDLPQYPRWTVIARDDFLTAQPKAASCYLAAMMRGERYAFSHPAAAEALAAKDIGGATKPSDPIVTNMYQQIVKDKLINPNAQLPLAKLNFQQQVLIDLGLLQHMLPLSEIYDDQYRQAALKMVGGVQ